MATLILDEEMEEEIRSARAKNGGDKYDEVWEGIYVMAALPNNEHQQIVGGIHHAFYDIVQASRLGRVLPGANVSDRKKDWKQNYRCPDVVVFLNGSTAIDRGTHWLGGPDLAVEVVSERDRAWEKLPFYASIGVRELLIVDRFPWSLQLYRLSEGTLQLAGKALPDDGDQVASTVLPMTMRLVSDEDRPAIEVNHNATGQRWLI